MGLIKVLRRETEQNEKLNTCVYCFSDIENNTYGLVPPPKYCSDSCYINAMQDALKKKSKPSNEELLDDLIRAASDNNEFDNRSNLEYYRNLVLSRMRKQKVK